MNASEQDCLAASAKVQLRVIGALTLREILTRYGRHNIGFLWLFVEPMIFTLGISALWSFANVPHDPSVPIVAFAITGYSSILLWRNMPNRCIGAIGPNLALMYHRNVKAIDVFISRIVLEAAGATMSFMVLATLFFALGMIPKPHDLLQILLAWTLLAWFGAGLAMTLGALAESSEVVEKLWHPATYLLFPLSGAAFTVDMLPPAAREIVLILPMVHGVELLREGYFGTAISAHYDLLYLVSICMTLSLTGLFLLRRVSNSLTPE